MGHLLAGVFVVPLFSWYNPEFDTEDPQLEAKLEHSLRKSQIFLSFIDFNLYLIVFTNQLVLPPGFL